MNHAAATKLAQRIIDELADACDRIEVAGSLRRGRGDVKDIDLLAISRRRQTDLLGEQSRPEAVIQLEAWRDAGRVIPGTGWNLDPRIITFSVPAAPRLKIELNLVDADHFGSWLAIRTGPADFSRRLVTPRQRGGFLPGDLRWGNRFRLYQGNTHLWTPEEADVFRWLNLEWVEPNQRL